MNKCEYCNEKVKKSELKQCQGLEHGVNLCPYHQNVTREGNVYCNECWEAL